MGKSSKKKKSNKKLTEREIEEKRKKCLERVRKYREKMSEEKKAEIRAKDREYKQEMKEAGVIKNINQLSNREQRMKRRQWKKDSYNYRIRQNIKKDEIVKESTTLGRKGSPRVQSGRKNSLSQTPSIKSEILSDNETLEMNGSQLSNSSNDRCSSLNGNLEIVIKEELLDDS